MSDITWLSHVVQMGPNIVNGIIKTKFSNSPSGLMRLQRVASPALSQLECGVAGGVRVHHAAAVHHAAVLAAVRPLLLRLVCSNMN